MGDGLNSFSLDDVAASVRIYGSVVVITTFAHADDFEKDGRFKSTVIGRQGSQLAVRISAALKPG